MNSKQQQKMCTQRKDAAKEKARDKARNKYRERQRERKKAERKRETKREKKQTKREKESIHNTKSEIETKKLKTYQIHRQQQRIYHTRDSAQG